MIHHELLSGDEHLRFSAAKAIDALLGVSHDKHAGRLRPAARTHVAAEPGLQRLPLQRIGVLKFVNQKMADACVQPLLHPATQHRIRQQVLGCAFNVVHVHPAALAFECRESGDHDPCQSCHMLLIEPGFVLSLRSLHAQQFCLCLAHLFDARYLVTEFARRTVFGQQGRQNALRDALGERKFKLTPLRAEAGLAGAAQGFGSRP